MFGMLSGKLISKRIGKFVGLLNGGFGTQFGLLVGFAVLNEPDDDAEEAGQILAILGVLAERVGAQSELLLGVEHVLLLTVHRRLSLLNELGQNNSVARTLTGLHQPQFRLTFVVTFVELGQARRHVVPGQSSSVLDLRQFIVERSRQGIEHEIQQRTATICRTDLIHILQFNRSVQ